MKRCRIAFLPVAIFLCVAAGNAQTAVTSIHGTVLDQSGAALPNARVSLSDPETGFKSERVTDARGEYAFEQIKPDTYTILVSAQGFSSQKQLAELLVNQAGTADFKLTVAAASGETVEVLSAASALNSSDATVGTPFDTEQIQSLPFEGNNVLDLLSLQAGVLFLGDQTQSQMNSDSRSGAVDGARSDQSNVTLDGVDDNDQNAGYAFSGVLRSTRDSVEEFRVVTTNSNADSGRSSGAQVSLVTRSGTNAYHGSVYEYYRPTNTVANDWFNKQAEISSGEPDTPPKLLAQHLRWFLRRSDLERQALLLCRVRRTANGRGPAGDPGSADGRLPGRQRNLSDSFLRSGHCTGCLQRRRGHSFSGKYCLYGSKLL